MMIITQPFTGTANQGLVTIRPLSSIALLQVEIIAQAVHASEWAWNVQTFDDYDGYLSILVEPSVRGDKHKTFFVAGTAQHIELFEVYDDCMTSVATFKEVEELSARLLDLIGQQ